MSNVIVKDNESLDSALRRFKRNCAALAFQEFVKESIEKPSVRRVRKSLKLLVSVSTTNSRTEIVHLK